MPTLFTLRDDDLKIIAVMSSNVDDLPEAMISVLQQFSVGKRNMVASGFAEKNFDKTMIAAFMPQQNITPNEYNQSLTT